jgi:hypothetical protein
LAGRRLEGLSQPAKFQMVNKLRRAQGTSIRDKWLDFKLVAAAG